jgi:hypothetical protein
MTAPIEAPPAASRMLAPPRAARCGHSQDLSRSHPAVAAKARVAAQQPTPAPTAHQPVQDEAAVHRGQGDFSPPWRTRFDAHAVAGAKPRPHGDAFGAELDGAVGEHRSECGGPRGRRHGGGQIEAENR